MSVNLPIAVAVGAQARAFARQLAELQAARAALGHQAAHDPLTGLPNRSRLEQYAALHEGERLGLLLLDLNDFKQVNESLGHAAGDHLLRIVGQRLHGCVRDGDLAARLGGDEFVVLLPGADAATTQEVAARVRAALTTPVELAGRAVAVRASIGAALRPAGADVGLAALTAEADAAMYAAKTADRRVRRVSEAA